MPSLKVIFHILTSTENLYFPKISPKNVIKLVHFSQFDNKNLTLNCFFYNECGCINQILSPSCSQKVLEELKYYRNCPFNYNEYFKNKNKNT